MFKSGFVSFVGRPNVGKSTLLNKIIGQRVSIVSKHPGTTQRTVSGIYNSANSQIVFIDTPGYAKPRRNLGVRLNDSVSGGVSQADIIIFCVPVNEKIGPGDLRILKNFFVSKVFVSKGLRKIPADPKFSEIKKIAVITKADTVGKDALLNKIIELDQLKIDPTDDFQEKIFAEIVPVSAKSGYNLTELISLLKELLPNGPKYYDVNSISLENENITISELVRQEVLNDLKDELMHSVAVTLDEESDNQNIKAVIFVERDSQKQIIIGKKGSKIGNIRRSAKRSIKKQFPEVKSLQLRVKVAPNWQQNTKYFEKFSI
ncbi:MAG: GTPase Era [Bifidobacteriaceae bacterium]|jgi:GTP-binding protein Era|nr:GTPase Era [Bifidobacteriaceae bacterium]